MPVAGRYALAAGTALVGDFSKAVLYDRRLLAITLGRNEPQEQWESAVCEGNKAVHVAFGLDW